MNNYNLKIYNLYFLISEAVIAVNPFKIPKHLHKDFLEDYMDIVRDMRLLDEQNNNVQESVSVRAQYKIIIAYGKK